MIRDALAALAALGEGPARALLPPMTEVRLIVPEAVTAEGEDALLALTPLAALAGSVADLPHRDTLERLLDTGQLTGWLTCQSETFLVEGPSTKPPEAGVMLDADLAFDTTIGLQIRHLGRQRWRITTLAELPADATTGQPALAEPVAFEAREKTDSPATDKDIVLHYRRFWQFTPEAEAHTPYSRLAQVSRKDQR